MKVTLIDYTGIHHTNPQVWAENILITAKNTRLLHGTSMEEADNTRGVDRALALHEIARTIPSSWEFVHYTILIEGVTRAFTHQLVRTRTASYAQQTMRIIDMTDFDYFIPDGLPPSKEGEQRGAEDEYREAMEDINDAYREMIRLGAPAQAARGILPTNIKTNIMMSANLRTVVDLVRKRSSSRVQGEYRQFITNLQVEIQRVHPFTSDFFGLGAQSLRKDLAKEVKQLEPEQANKIVKLFDKLVEIVS